MITHQSLGSSLGRMLAKMTSSLGRELLWNFTIFVIWVCLASLVKLTWDQIFCAASFILPSWERKFRYATLY